MKRHELTVSRSITKEMEELLNEQIHMEASASAKYLDMASWAEAQGHDGIASFLYKHSDEERGHMMRIFRYVNEAGGQARVPVVEKMPGKYKPIRAVFEQLVEHELSVSRSINRIVAACLSSGDYSTHRFLGWFLEEQREEETIARKVLSLFDTLGETPTGLHLINKTLSKLHESKN